MPMEKSTSERKLPSVSAGREATESADESCANVSGLPCAKPEYTEIAGRKVPTVPVPLEFLCTDTITDAVAVKVKRKKRPRWLSPQSASVASAQPKALLMVWLVMFVAGFPTTSVPKFRPE